MKPQSESQICKIVSLALAEDLDEGGDITSRAVIDPGAAGAARVVTRQSCTVSGMGAAAEVCRQVDPALTWLPLRSDGGRIPAGTEVARLEGRLASILAAERTLLNFLSRLSGVATLTAAFVEAVSGTGAAIAATRKTSPGLRLLEKQAVVNGGGLPHRAGLYDAVLVKDNHIAAAGGVAEAMERIRAKLGDSVDIEIEVDTIAQLKEALSAGARRVLLDNMTSEMVKECSALAAGLVEIEASGGIGLASARQFAEAGAGIISAGAITRDAPGIDFSLELEP